MDCHTILRNIQHVGKTVLIREGPLNSARDNVQWFSASMWLAMIRAFGAAWWPTRKSPVPVMIRFMT